MAPLQESSRLELTIALAATTTYVETGSEPKGAVVLQQELLCFPFSKKEKNLQINFQGARQLDVGSYQCGDQISELDVTCH